jgi:16S rRNA (guanine527-N7)-methyltransferase
MKNFSKSYLKLLTEDFKTINLTRIESEDEFYNKQILDSVLPLEKSSNFKNSILESKILVDVGFGGGFPILPLAFSMPENKFFGIDARAKKVQAVGEIATRLELKNVKLFHARLEEIEFDIPVVMTLKAVGKIEDILSLITTTKKMKIFFYKGPNYKDLEDLEKIKGSWNLFEETNYDVEGTEGRVILGFENKHVLRGTTIKDDKKIKFSSLL